MPLPDLTPAPSQAAETLAAGPAAPAKDRPTPATTRRATARRDVQVVRTSYQKPISDEPATPKRHLMKETPQIAARVGDDVITCHDLRTAIGEFCAKKKVPWRKLPPQEQTQIGLLVLNHLIDRSLLTQEAKHAIKDPKQYDKFMEAADHVWREEELPPMEYQYVVDSEQLLREKLKEHGRSLDQMRETFRQEFLAENFVHQKLKDRLKVELPDLKKYYHEHVGKHEFDRPAQITWRELVVEVGRYPSRDDARRKANDLYDKLRRGADFAQLARAESDGPSSSREQGGLMQTAPGTYAVQAVNDVLPSLPIGQFSDVLEGGNSFHIVRVDERRPAGAASFAEVQDKIRSILTDQRLQTERGAFIAKLRQKTLITTILDQTDSDSGQAAQ
jgi:peptidyl-prolyl cis-trans isomerase SurA